MSECRYIIEYCGESGDTDISEFHIHKDGELVGAILCPRTVDGDSSKSFAWDVVRMLNARGECRNTPCCQQQELVE